MDRRLASIENLIALLQSGRHGSCARKATNALVILGTQNALQVMRVLKLSLPIIPGLLNLLTVLWVNKK